MIGIAVVIAARNPGVLLAETLDSLEVQTRPASITVIVDDGSTDDVIDRTAAGRAGVVVMRQAPLGAATARNTGAEAARSAGALIFVDADDVLEPWALEVLGAELDADPSIDMVHGRTFEFVDLRFPPLPGVRSRDVAVSARLAGCTLMRRSLWDRVGALDPTLGRGEWIDWMSRASESGAAVRAIDDVVLRRRLHSSNGTAASDGNRDYLAVARAALLRRRQGEQQ